MDSMDELRSPSLPTSPAASIIVLPSPSTLSSSSFSGQYGVQRNRGQLKGSFNTVQFGPRPVLNLFRAEGLKGRGSSVAARLSPYERQTPFVGREAELESLEEWMTA